ncbi:hypothetical protein GCWU000341_02523 [Oribacterium sp. oral taxon 078 str. F0262]|nr:hypothetical protein GCWU000341_02523 [Oribacterium sp. oral taxon 078 str. F0262]
MLYLLYIGSRFRYPLPGKLLSSYPDKEKDSRKMWQKNVESVMILCPLESSRSLITCFFYMLFTCFYALLVFRSL